jgi:hypothetical protein
LAVSSVSTPGLKLPAEKSSDRLWLRRMRGGRGGGRFPASPLHQSHFLKKNYLKKISKLNFKN